MSVKKTHQAERFKLLAEALSNSIQASKTDLNWANSIEVSYLEELNAIGRDLLGSKIDLFKVLDHRQEVGKRANTWRFIRFFYADPVNYRAGEFNSKELTRWQYQADGISCLLISRNEAAADAICGVLNVWARNVAEIARKSRTVNVRMIEFARENPELVATFTTSIDWAEHLGMKHDSTIRRQPFYKQWKREQKFKVENPKSTAVDRLNPRDSENEDF